MEKSFGIALVIGIIALGVFAYFIFGFNQRPTEQVLTSTPSPAEESPTTDSSPSADLKIEDIQVGTGQEVKSGDTVVIHYLGTLTDGTKFDSSYDRNEPFETQVGVGSVIKGWDVGVVGMKVGGKRKLTIPPSMGYGSQQSGPIPPNSTLIFELELVAVK